MIKIFLSFFTLIMFTNNSYASFPVSDTLKVNHDTIIKESVKDYHLRLQKMGFELESGKKDYSTYTKMSSGSLFSTGFILFLLSLTTFFISTLDFFRCIDRTETCNQSGVPYFILSFVFFWSSIFFLVKGYIIRRKKRNISDA